MNRSDFAKLIDHTALKPETTHEQVSSLCEEAINYGFGAVCVSPVWLSVATANLRGSQIRVATVIGFPHGDTLSKVKAFEASKAIEAGAQELDMVMPVGVLKSGDHRTVLKDIQAVGQL